MFTHSPHCHLTQRGFGQQARHGRLYGPDVNFSVGFTFLKH